ncbi:hypothetical protein DERF_008113 [Dermatophagoides farinae]|uniref:Uncharacterized protein n=1 Tax=Dermatophagoides farinae TaxID=6954 RepID=A0A922L8U1_DERFA|nr:hypothetical protein DERF_008113 [Dermatophagoides farinae]
MYSSTIWKKFDDIFAFSKICDFYNYLQCIWIEYYDLMMRDENENNSPQHQHVFNTYVFVYCYHHPKFVYKDFYKLSNENLMAKSIDPGVFIMVIFATKQMGQMMMVLKNPNKTQIYQ